MPIVCLMDAALIMRHDYRKQGILIDNNLSEFILTLDIADYFAIALSFPAMTLASKKNEVYSLYFKLQQASYVLDTTRYLTPIDDSSM